MKINRRHCLGKLLNTIKPVVMDLKKHGNNNTQLTTSSSPVAISLQIPPFYPTDSKLWFRQVELLLAISGIKDDTTKFQIVAGSVDTTYISDVRHIVMNPPLLSKYDELKSELIHQQEQKVKRLLDLEEIGDQKPSEFLRHLQKIAGKAVAPSVIRSRWQDCLPPTVRAGIWTKRYTDMETLAILADKVCEDYPKLQPSEAPKTSWAEAIRDLAISFCNMSASVAPIQSELVEIQEEGYCRCNDRSASRNSTHSQDSIRSANEFCWYHTTYGAEARKCTPPCSFR